MIANGRLWPATGDEGCGSSEPKNPHDNFSDSKGWDLGVVARALTCLVVATIFGIARLLT
jgi:hypothetical protein